jgi:hypothetical protein
MSNFGTRLAYPVERTAPRRADANTASATTRAQGFAARVLAALTRALDEAPFDLAWPPSPRSYARRPLD